MDGGGEGLRFVGSTIWAGSNVKIGGGFESSSANSGGYWTWANAKSGGADYTGQVTNYTTGNLDNSVCPRGWRLPTAYEFQTLIGASGIDGSVGDGRAYYTAGIGLRVTGKDLNGNNAVLTLKDAGHAGGINSGSHGNYWSSTEHKYAWLAYYFYFYSNLSSGHLNNNDRQSVLSVRCVRPT